MCVYVCLCEYVLCSYHLTNHIHTYTHTHTHTSDPSHSVPSTTEQVFGQTTHVIDPAPVCVCVFVCVYVYMYICVYDVFIV